MDKKLIMFASALVVCVPLVFGQSAKAWDGGGPWGFHHFSSQCCDNYGGYQMSYQGNYGGGCEPYGPLSYQNGWSSGLQDATYDHDNSITYNPYPQLSCHSDVYNNAFHEGYDHQWQSYESQESSQGTSVNVVNSPGAEVSVNQESNQQQNPLQQLGHIACGIFNCNGAQAQAYEGP